MTGMISILSVLARDLHMSAEAARCMVGHGQVSVDGRTVGLDEVEWRREDIAGRMLQAGKRQMRVLGSRRLDQCPVEEVGLPVRIAAPTPVELIEEQLSL